MTDTEKYKKNVLSRIIETIQPHNDILGAWEGGSAATGTSDQFSDIDLCIITDSPLQGALDLVETSLEKFSVIHKWEPKKSFFGEGIRQRVFLLKDAPKYFLVDVTTFEVTGSQPYKDFLEFERHGEAIVLFDKQNLIRIGHTDPQTLATRHKSRLEDLQGSFPIFKTLVLKEIERGRPLDAIWFYQNGLVRPLVEVMGMIYRPFKFDFGMRYIHRTFPPEKQKLLEELNYVSDIKDLSDKVERAEREFLAAVSKCISA